MTATLAGALTRVSALLDQLDAVAVGVAHEADPVTALAHPVRRLLGGDALSGQLAERAVEVVDGERDVVVAGAELVRVDAVVVGELEAVAVAGEAHEDVDRLVADRHPPALLEAQRLVELHRAVDVADPVAGVNELHGAQYVASTRAGPPEPSFHGIRPITTVAPRRGSWSRLARFSIPTLSARSSRSPSRPARPSGCGRGGARSGAGRRP